MSVGEGILIAIILAVLARWKHGGEDDKTGGGDS